MATFKRIDPTPRYPAPFFNPEPEPVVETPAPSISEFHAALNRYVAYVQDITDVYMREHFSSLASPKIRIELGSKNVRVIKDEGHTRSVHTFVRIADGAILKAAGWKAPAPRGVRGSIYKSDDWDRVITHHGAAYLR